MNFEIGYIWLAGIELFSHFIQGCTGFGATVIASSVVIAQLGTVDGIPFGTLVSMPALYIMGILCFKNVSWKDVLKIVLACVPGVLVGRVLTPYLNPAITKIIIGCIIMFVAVTNLYKIFRKNGTEEAEETPQEVVYRYVCLMIGAIIQGALSMGGPFITIYAIRSVKEKERFCNTMNWVWILINSLLIMPGQYLSGAWNQNVLNALMVCVPIAILGFALGRIFLKKINQQQALRIIYAVLLIVGSDMLVRGIGAL